MQPHTREGEDFDFAPEELAALFPALTRAEAEVLHWLAEGKRNAEIAIILGKSPRAVRGHVGNALAKLGAECRCTAEAMVWRARVVECSRHAVCRVCGAAAGRQRARVAAAPGLTHQKHGGVLIP